MAQRGCKCRDGSYRRSCCNSTKRSTRGTRSSRNRRSNKKRSTTMGGPMSPQEYATRRRQQAFVHILTTPQGRKAMAYAAMQAEKGYTKVLGRKAASRASLALYAGGRVGSKFIPIVGQISLAYDTYRLGKWMHGKLQG
jgi:hypothetical protein